MSEAAALMARRLWYATGLLMLAAYVRSMGKRAEAATMPRATQTDLLWAKPARPPAAARTEIFERWSARAGLIGLVAVAVAAIASRVRYIAAFDGTYGSGDAHGILVRALFMREGNLSPSSQLALTGNIFDQPPLLPAVLALLSRTPGISLEIAPLILMPALTVAAVVVLYRLLARTLGLPIAIAASLVFALFPRWSFDSTEPDKGPAVMSLCIFALAATEMGSRDRRFLPLGGLFLALAMMTHTTAYFFVPVVIGAHLAWNAKSIRGAFSKHALAAMIFPVAAVLLYFALARRFAGPPLDDPTTAGASGSVLPSFVQTYVDAMRNLVAGGFSDSAWGVYFTGIRNQLGTPVFVCALGAFGVAAYEIVVERRWQLVPYVLWAGLVTLAFAIQYPAASHGSRYPGYVTPVYIVLACYFALRLGGLALAWGSPVTRAAGLCGLVALAAYAGATYAFAPDPGLRDLYASHAKAASYIDENGLLDDDSAMLYMGWPSITLNILEGRPDYEDRLITFGFGSRDLATFNADFVHQHGIRYYLFDHTGRDAQGSPNVVLRQLSAQFALREVATFTGRPGSFSTLYELRDRPNPSDAQVRQLLRDGSAVLHPPAIGGAICTKDGVADGWQSNGVVSLSPVIANDGSCALRVENHKEWGGIRGAISATMTSDSLMAVAAVEPSGQNTAQTAVLELYAGSRLIGRTEEALAPGQNLMFVQGYAPANPGDMIVVLATGEGDAGDLLIDGVVVTSGSAASLPALEGG